MKNLLPNLFLIFSSLFSYSQNVGIGTTNPDSSAALEIKSSSQGFLPPRLTTTQRNAIVNPAEGLQIFNTTTKCLQIYAYGFWQNIYCAQSTEQPSTLTNGLVAYYPFNGNANDESGNGNNGVVNGATLTTDRFGNENKAFGFNGINNWIEVLSNQALNFNHGFSISCWIQGNNNNQYGTIISKERLPNGGSYLLSNFDANIVLGINNDPIGGGCNNCNLAVFANLINTSNWHQLVSIWDGSNLKVFIDGYLNNTGIGTLGNGGSLLNYSSNLKIGRYLNVNDLTNFFNGKIDDISIYNRALTQEEITYLATH